MNIFVDRCCVVTQGDTHPLFQRNLDQARPPVEVYLRDSHKACDVKEYMTRVQQIEALCFNEPSPRFALAHFGLNGPAMVVTAEVGREVVAAQYIVWDGHAEGRRGLRFWTTVVNPELRGYHIASTLTAVATVATQSWAEYGSTICDTNSSLMGRNVRLRPIIVTANMFHTEGRRKVQLEWERPEDPFTTLFRKPEPATGAELSPLLHTLHNSSMGPTLPRHFAVPSDAQVWDDISESPDLYRRRFRLIGWQPQTRTIILENTWAPAHERYAPGVSGQAWRVELPVERAYDPALV